MRPLIQLQPIMILFLPIIRGGSRILLRGRHTGRSSFMVCEAHLQNAKCEPSRGSGSMPPRKFLKNQMPRYVILNFDCKFSYHTQIQQQRIIVSVNMFMTIFVVNYYYYRQLALIGSYGYLLTFICNNIIYFYYSYIVWASSLKMFTNSIRLGCSPPKLSTVSSKSLQLFG